MERRSFLLNISGIVGGVSTLPVVYPNVKDISIDPKNISLQNISRDEGMNRIGTPITIMPVLLYNLLERKEGETWREWGGLRNSEDVNKEILRINKELKELKLNADFKTEFLPLFEVNTDMSATEAVNTECDVILLFAAGTAGNYVYDKTWINLLIHSGKHIIVFLRHKSGPTYLWYEIIHPTLLRQQSDKFVLKNLSIEDVVVDDYNKVLVRLRALYGLKNIQNTKILAINGIGSWGGHLDKVKNAINNLWHLGVIPIGNDELISLVKEMHKDDSILKQAHNEVENFTRQDSIISINTKKEFLINTFVLYYALKKLMEKYEAEGVTINGCMGIGKSAQTTPCLAFSLINDEGLLAFCESDFNVIPSGILLRHIAGKPVFLNDPTLPNEGITTCAHCHSPRRMNGKDLEPTHIYTHCESDFGAAPKVEFRKGQMITNIIPDFNQNRWMGFSGTIIDHPFYAICRSQFDCTIDGDWEKLVREMRGFHWMTCYGDYLKEMDYVTRKVGIQFENISNFTSRKF